VILALTLSLVLAGAAQDASSQAKPTLERAQSAYRDGDYEGAKQLWESWLAERPAGDGRVFYNLGNCEYRLGDYPRALWRYEQAERLLGESKSLSFNLSLARRRLSVHMSHTGGLWASVRAAVASWRPATWFWLGAVLQGLGLVVLWRVFSRPTRLRVTLVVLLLVPGSLAVARSRSMDLSAPRGVVVLADRTALRAEPREELDAVTWLNAGVRARFLAETPDWLRVRVGDREGWIPRDRGGVF